MPFDAVYMSALRQELSPVLEGARIDKINQPEKDELVFNLRTNSGNRKLLISARPSGPRLHLTGETFENPASPPMFCMLMRKHLAGARINAITQPGLERVLTLSISAMDELGELSEKQLIFEALGRQPNLILVGADGRIIDSVRRVDSDLTSGRPILPGMFYRLPEKQAKLDPLEVTLEDIQASLPQGDIEAHKYIMSTFSALPPIICRELSYRLLGDVDARLGALDDDGRNAFVQGLLEFFNYIREGSKSPTLLVDDNGTAKDICYMPIHQYDGIYVNRSIESFSALTQSFYSARDRGESMKSRAQSVRKTVRNHYDRTLRRLENQRRELEATYDREQLRQKGDLLMANLHLMTKGMPFVEVEDLYDPDQPLVRISLDPLLSPQQNASKYYKNYAKAKNAEKVLTEQIISGEKELDYLGSVLDEIDRAQSETELKEIREELTASGYLKKVKGGKKEKFRASKPMSFRSSTGFDISVGRNNTQNDQLTTKTAFKSDIWLHTQKIHGSHVVIHCEGRTPDNQTITEAAMLAAYYSQARDGRNVPVDYTPVKYVKKPGGARPGMVVYETYRTAYVTPDGDITEKLRI